MPIFPKPINFSPAYIFVASRG